MSDLDYRELAQRVQYGDEEEASAALEQIVEASRRPAREDEVLGDSDPVAMKIAERERKMQILLAKHRMSEARSFAESGDPRAIREYFIWRFPKIASDPGMYEDAQDEANRLIETGNSPHRLEYL
ncbi:MAG: hypothetical protein JRJ03_08760 [Deltaproteobacteria bacterium]|nr:hypothetical protein [Deltaproteobacteria bacterium]